MPSSPIVIKYPYDATGTSPNNLVMRETHTLSDGDQRAIVPFHGPFFAESVTIMDTVTGRNLSPDTQFNVIELYQAATQATGKEVCAAIVITDYSVSQVVEVQYQVVGGEYSFSSDGLQQVINGLDIDSRPVDWSNIQFRPAEYPAAPHLHDVGDIYGFEYLVMAMERLREAIVVGDEASHEEIRTYIRNIEGVISDNLGAHISDHTNPHNVTKAQVGLGSVLNYGVASEALAKEGRVNNLYMTPLRVAQAIDELVTKDLNEHIADRVNPHRVTKTQIGLSNVPNYPMATTAEGSLAGKQTSGVTNSKFMSPYLTAKAIETHRVSTDHPYAKESTQGMVRLASRSEILSGSGSDKVMDPPGYAATLDLDSNLFSKIRGQVERLVEEKAAIPMVGKFSWELATSLDSRSLEARGQIVSRNNYRLAWDYIRKHGRVVSDSSWSNNRGCFSSGNGSTTFRMPDLRGYYPRAYDSRKSETVGNLLDQAVLRHGHTGRADSAGAHTHGWDRPPTVAYGNGNSTNRKGLESDGAAVKLSSAGAHTHNVTIYDTGDDENRPYTTVLVFAMYAGPY